MVQGDRFDYFGLSGYSVDSLRALGYIVWTPPRPKGEFLGEGDTFTFLNQVDNGLRGYEESLVGGLGLAEQLDISGRRAIRSDQFL
jgi:hypothetical protein